MITCTESNLNNIDKATPTNYKLIFPLIPTETSIGANNPFVMNIFSAVLPSVSIGADELRWQGNKTRTGLIPMEFDPWLVSFIVDYKLANWKLLFKWMSYINNNYNKIAEEHKKYGVDCSLIVTDNYSNPVMEVIFVSIWPSVLGEVSFSQREGDILLESTVNFNYDYFYIKELQTTFDGISISSSSSSESIQQSSSSSSSSSSTSCVKQFNSVLGTYLDSQGTNYWRSVLGSYTVSGGFQSQDDGGPQIIFLDNVSGSGIIDDYPQKVKLVITPIDGNELDNIYIIDGEGNTIWSMTGTPTFTLSGGINNPTIIKIENIEYNPFDYPPSATDFIRLRGIRIDNNNGDVYRLNNIQYWEDCGSSSSYSSSSSSSSFSVAPT